MNKLAHYFLVGAFSVFLVLNSTTKAEADERVFSEYQYDEVGNIISRRQDKSGAAPSVDAVTPSTVRQNQTLSITLTGQGLRGARLGEQNDFFTFSNISSTNEQLQFTLAVDKNADQGSAQVSVSTGLGAVFFSLNVLSELPDLRVFPTPITLNPNAVHPLNISLSAIDVLDHVVNVTVADSSVATVSASQLNFTQGSIAVDAPLTIMAIANGATSLRFESDTLDNQTYTIRVSDDSFVLEPGSTHSFNSRAVGVNRLFIPPPPDLVAQGPFVAELRINKLFTPDDSPDLTNTAFANSVGVLKGRFHLPANPKAIGAGAQNVSVTIEGNGLANIDTVELIPNDNTVLSNVIAATNGESITFDLSVDADTPLSLRTLSLQDAAGNIPASTAQAGRVYIGGAAPVIESVTPIYLNRGDVRTITVRGVNLQTVRGLRFDNNDNLIFSSATVAGDGRSLTFGLEVIGFATLGPRAVILESLLGDSVALHSAANIINLEDRPPNVLGPIVSPSVGINKQVASTGPETTESVARSTVVGVSKGSTLVLITPNSRAQGASVTLQLSGVGLNDVISAEFEPAVGITVGDYIASADGTSATLAIDVANDAETTVRKLVLLTSSSALSALASADRFTITLPKPEISSVSPLLVDRSEIVVPITIRGELLNDASLVTIIPNAGVTASVPIASLDGRSVSVSLTIAPDAPLTPRIIQLTTPGGVTEPAAMLSNTINLVEGINSVVTPIISAQVGVLREVTPVPQAREVNSISVGVGLIKQFTPAVSTPQARFAYSSTVGLSKGPTAFLISPTVLPINTQGQTIEVTGTNLDDVVTVQTIPADGVTLTGPAIISADGTRVTFSATVASDAPQTSRRIELLTASGAVPFLTPASSQLVITSLQPQLESITPIQQVRGATFTMTVRGINLNNVQSIQATPANGIQFGTPVVAADGRSFTVAVIIDPAASTEQKVITVTTNAGTTTSAAMPENTFTVISE